ncbi:hypothetical protein AX16_001769 [Volvariella volvacea WC 439]|nr:hypothetical protein AX16_001769 [Volvariella volvacea WC 439]
MLLSDPLTLSSAILDTCQSQSSRPSVHQAAMAQPLYDDQHPLEQYLRDAGELSQSMPGTSSELTLELDPNPHLQSDAPGDYEEVELLPLSLIKLLEALQAAISTVQPSRVPKSFIERFKYDVISSSLLAPNLAVPQSRRSSWSASIPGKLKGHRRGSISSSESSQSPPSPPVASHGQYWIPSLALMIVVALFGSGHHLMAALSIAGSLVMIRRLDYTNDACKMDVSPCLDSLGQLIHASDVWESVVQEALAHLEKDEKRRKSFSSSKASSPTNSLRLTLHSTLHGLQTQCDNVRQLFSALASPVELSQLSEMYAPPSPMRPNVALPEASPRPLSLPHRHSPPSSSPLSREAKRSTWGGGTPSGQPFSRRERHRSDLSTLFAPTPPIHRQSTSAPVTPISSNHSSLDQVEEEDDNVSDQDTKLEPIEVNPESFAAAALDLRRRRKSAGLEALHLPSDTLFTTPTRPSRLSRTPNSATSIPSASRFTTNKTSRHPQSLSALHHALQGALASRRYTCSHLLALRFQEEDESYWEDVRSMMDLLASTFSGATSSLAEALEDVERQRIMDENPTPKFTPPKIDGEDIDVDDMFGGQRRPTHLQLGQRRSRLSDEVTSFAPTLSNISRFAIHVDSISTALDDAKAYLQDVVDTLKEEEFSSPARPKGKRNRESGSFLAYLNDGEDADGEELAAAVEELPKALEVYDRLRRELGLALRECERGRERLLEVVYPKPKILLDDEEDFSDELPGFGHDAASDDSDKAVPSSPTEESHRAGILPELIVDAPTVVGHVNDVPALDDATAHLLLTSTTEHLPPPGVDQVYEADAGSVGVFTRERSKLSREERIKLAKARRESAALGRVASDSPSSSSGGSIEKWGPGGDVVQELKDVIWKVGEKKRKMAEVAVSM